MTNKSYILTIVTLLLIGVGGFTQSFPQTSNFLLSQNEIESRYQTGDLKIINHLNLRDTGIVKRIILNWPDGINTLAKWKKVPIGGHETNNAPRYELAAYKFQKLFLEENELVVPPTVMRYFSFEDYKRIEDGKHQFQSTFNDIGGVCFVLAYWLQNVSTKNIFDQDRFDSDPAYARNVGNLNIFTYLIRHNDSNKGNFLISKDPANPRIYAVDNGMAFNSLESERGYEWRNIRISRLPRDIIEKVRKIDLALLQNTLGVVAQFRIKNKTMELVEPTESIDPEKGIRVSNGTVQFGLTRKEIKDIYDRQQKLLKKIDNGEIELF